jgi:hypothetical protein
VFQAQQVELAAQVAVAMVENQALPLLLLVQKILAAVVVVVQPILVPMAVLALLSFDMQSK